MLFRILPNVENVTGIFLLNAVCLVPAVLKIFYSSRRDMTRFKKFITVILDILAVLAQISVWFIFKLFNYKHVPRKDASGDINFLVLVALSTFLISLGWWQNFSEVRFTSNRFTLFIQRQISSLRKYNSQIYVLITPIKIGFIFLFTYILLPKHYQAQFLNVNKHVNLTQATQMSMIHKVHEMKELVREDIFFTKAAVYVPFIVHIASSIICYFTARIACKVLMQGMGFSLPLSMATPVTFLVLLISSFRSNYSSVMFNGNLSSFFYLDGFDRK